MKKLEKLNLRITEDEREQFAAAAQRDGFESVSAWCREVLQRAAASTLARPSLPSRDVALQISTGRLLATTSGEGDGVIEVALPDGVVVEGLIMDPEAVMAAVKDAFHRLSERYDLGRAKVLVTGRILPSTIPQLKSLVTSATDLGTVLTIEYTMANALGLGLDVRSPVPQPVLSIDRDWSEIGVVCGAGLERKRSVGSAEPAVLDSHREDLARQGEVRVAINDATRSPALDGTRLALKLVRGGPGGAAPWSGRVSGNTDVP